MHMINIVFAARRRRPEVDRKRKATTAEATDGAQPSSKVKTEPSDGDADGDGDGDGAGAARSQAAAAASPSTDSPRYCSLKTGKSVRYAQMSVKERKDRRIPSKKDIAMCKRCPFLRYCVCKAMESTPFVLWHVAKIPEVYFALHAVLAPWRLHRTRHCLFVLSTVHRSN